jgi:two-component system NtrC family response regulator
VNSVRCGELNPKKNPIMADILIIDDDAMMCDTLSQVLAERGHDVIVSQNLTEGLENAFSGSFDVVFLDVVLPDGNGLDALPKIRLTPSAPEVIIMTGAGDPDGAELAIRSGAWDYIQKPATLEAMTLPLVRALQYRDEKKTTKPAVFLKREGIVGNSAKLKRSLDLLAQVATSDANVLITGETGTGKELFARAIHANSYRAKGNFVVVDCAALPSTLVESVLFGHKKGAFTGADQTQEGLVLQADGGTLFLDEVGELPIPVQKAFLRVLQEHRFRPVGGRKEVESRFRLVSATNRNLDEVVRYGGFRGDLLFRLRSFTIDLPPLRNRTEDIRELAMYHMGKLCQKYGTDMKGFSPEFFEALASYSWPGNVRELINTLERVLVSARQDPTLFPKHLPAPLRIQIARASVSQVSDALTEDIPPQKDVPDATLPKYRSFRQSVLDDAEKRYIGDLMVLAHGNIKQACHLSGLGRTRLYTLMKKHGISRFGWPKPKAS